MRGARKVNNVGGLMAAGLIGLTAWGCAKNKPVDMTGTAGVSTTTGVGAGNAKQYRISVVPKGAQNQFWVSMHEGADAAGKEAGAEIVWQPPNPENNIDDQINVVNNQVIAKADGIVLAAIDAKALVQVVDQTAQKGIPIVTVDSGLESASPVCYIATDNVRGGREAAKALAAAIGDKGKVGLLYFQKGSASSDQREQGFVEEMKAHPGIQIVSSLESGDVTKAIDATTNMMTANPDIVGIFASNEPNGVGSANVLRQRKLTGKVKIVAFDASDEELRDLEDGSIDALIVQDPYQMGYKGVKTVLAAIKKEPIPSKTIDSGLTVVTKANLNTPEVQKLVHPAK